MSERLFASSGPWLFSRRIDLLAFGGSALLSWLLVALGAWLGLLDRAAPAWTFVALVVAVDVAHVWSTGFRVYFDGAELRARPLLYIGVPAAAYLAGVSLHALSALAFWRALAYLAVFHFVRQQVGFMRLYARRNPAQTALDSTLEQASLYASMLYPLLYWHAHLPRAFTWFVQGDFVEDRLVQQTAERALPVAELGCFLLLGAFFLRQLQLARGGHWLPGKSVLMVSTFSCWVLGIVVFDSDYVFTVTNVLIHGVPYFVLTQRYARSGARLEPERRASLARRIARAGVLPALAVCVVLAALEETLWDGLVWHEHLGADSPLASGALLLVVPLLAVPQVTHYVLDGYVWRVRSHNPVLRRELESA
ncbi:MAG: hypothetical protein JWN48_1023 [Myxococcaceae bacterium]|nr:hypothetical protein [Myxococcaceae bacterium]